MKITKSELLRRIEALEQENKQRGIGNQFMTLKCIQGNRHFTKDATYCASKLFDRTVITTNFGSRKELEVNTNIFGGYKVTDENQTAVLQVIGADVEPEPKLKQLDQSVFDGLDAQWRFAAVDSDGFAGLFKDQPYVIKNRWSASYTLHQNLGSGYDASNWQNSLIERESVELTGSEDANTLSDTISDIVDELMDSEYFYSKITCELLERGCSYVLTYVSDISEQDAIKNKEVAVIDSVDALLNDVEGNDWKYAVPINNQGEPLTASEVGL